MFIHHKTLMSLALFALLLGAGVFGATFELPSDGVTVTPLRTISRSTATPSPLPTVYLTATAQASESIALVVKNSRLMAARTAPSTNADIATLVPPGITVTILQKASGDTQNPSIPWYYVRFSDGSRGWMRSDMLDIIWPLPPTSTPAPSAVPPRPPAWRSGTRLKVNNPNGAWLRRTPSSYAARVATAAFQNLVTATGNKYFDGGRWWWEVRADWGAVGWVEQVSLIPVE